MSRIRCAVVGCGHIGRRHIETIRQHPGFALAALVDPDEGQAANFDVPVFAGLDQLISSELRPDLVTIATPNGLHAAQAVQALEAGCHTLIEKPMAIRSAEARTVVETAARTGRTAHVVMQNRYTAEAQWLKSLVASGRLGRLFLVQVTCLWNRDRRYYTPGSWHGDQELDGGTLFTQFSHFVDMLYWLFGSFGNIQARVANLNHPELQGFEDTGMAQFDFSAGGMGALQFTTAAWDRNAESSLTIVAENGTVRLSGQYMNAIELGHIKGMPERQIAEELEAFRSRSDGRIPHYAVYSHLAAAIHGDTGPTHSAEEGLKVVELIEAIYAAAKQA
jgi:UDP-N-acetyl-2-amino-2-deoxyglucuronate dehydrogenase